MKKILMSVPRVCVAKKPMVFGFSSLLVVIVSIVTGCGPFKPGVDIDLKIDQIDKALTTIDKISDESAQWRKTLPELADQVGDIGSKFAEHDLRNLSSQLSSDASRAGIVFTDHTERKIKGYLKAFRDVLKEVKEDLKTAKTNKDDDAVSRAIDKLADIVVFLDPYVSNIIPSKVTLNPDGPLANIVQIHGWGFDRPNGERLDMQLIALNSKGETRPCQFSVAKTTNYLLQLDLQESQLGAHRDETKLVFSINGTERELPIDYSGSTVPKRQPIPHKVLVDSPDDYIWYSTTFVPGLDTVRVGLGLGEHVTWKKGLHIGDQNVQVLCDIKGPKKMEVFRPSSGVMKLEIYKERGFPLGYQRLISIDLNWDELNGHEVVFFWEKDHSDIKDFPRIH